MVISGYLRFIDSVTLAKFKSSVFTSLVCVICIFCEAESSTADHGTSNKVAGCADIFGTSACSTSLSRCLLSLVQALNTAIAVRNKNIFFIFKLTVSLANEAISMLLAIITLFKAWLPLLAKFCR